MGGILRRDQERRGGEGLRPNPLYQAAVVALMLLLY